LNDEPTGETAIGEAERLERKRTETDLDNFTDLSIGEDWDPIFSDLSVLRNT